MDRNDPFKFSVPIGRDGSERDPTKALDEVTTRIALRNTRVATAIQRLDTNVRGQLEAIFNREGSADLGVLRMASDDDYAAAQIQLFEAAVQAGDTLKAKVLGEKIHKLTE